MAIEFDKIPTSVRHPGVYSEFNTKMAVSSLPTNEQEVLILAPMTAQSDTDFTSPLRVYSDVEAAEAFGYGSWAHLMTRIAIKNNPYIRLSVMGLKDHKAGVAAKGSITINGTATSQGVITATIANVDYQISVSQAETAENLATRLSAVINADTDAVVTAQNESGTVNLTAKCKGAIGNEISLTCNNTAKSISISGNAFANGETNADLTDALAAIAGTHYHIIISPFNDDKNAKALREHLETVSSPIERKRGLGVMAFTGTMSAGSTFTEKLNHERVTVGWYKGATDSVALIAAGYGSVIAGEEDPARPLNTLEIKGIAETDGTQKPTWNEANQALFHGLTPITVVNHKVQIMRAITTYTKNATNTDDPSWLDLTTIRTMDYTAKAIEQRLALRFPRAKLTTRKGNNTPQKVRSEILDVLYRLENADILEPIEPHKDKLLVQRSQVDANTLDTAVPADVVNGLHVIRNRIDLIL